MAGLNSIQDDPDEGHDEAQDVQHHPTNNLTRKQDAILTGFHES